MQETINWMLGSIQSNNFIIANKNIIKFIHTDIYLIEKLKNFLDIFKISFNFNSIKRGKQKREYTLDINLIDFQKVDSSTTTSSITNDLFWLLGIFETCAEFTLKKCYKNIIKPEIKLINSDINLIKNIETILKMNSCSFYIWTSQHNENKFITIQGLLRCNKFINKTKDYWSTKLIKQKVLLIDEFIQSRLLKEQKQEYSAKEKEIYNTLKEINS